MSTKASPITKKCIFLPASDILKFFFKRMGHEEEVCRGLLCLCNRVPAAKALKIERRKEQTLVICI
jgi:hypothetical protein